VIGTTRSPTRLPSRAPSRTPTHVPSREPTEVPTRVPTRTPTFKPSVLPTSSPSSRPTTATPTVRPSREPSSTPSVVPTEVPTFRPTRTPTYVPTRVPTRTPTSPTVRPTRSPTVVPTRNPTEVPTVKPSRTPTEVPTVTPSRTPTEIPTRVPTEVPTNTPTRVPSEVPTRVPSREPTEVPTRSPTETPTTKPSAQPSEFISYHPSAAGIAGVTKDAIKTNADAVETVDVFFAFVIGLTMVFSYEYYAYDYAKKKIKFEVVPSTTMSRVKRASFILMGIFSFAGNIMLLERFSIDPEITYHITYLLLLRLIIMLFGIPLLYEIYGFDAEDEEFDEKLISMIDSPSLSAFPTYYFVLIIWLLFDPTLLQFLPWKVTEFTTTYAYPTRKWMIYCNAVQLFFTLMIIIICANTADVQGDVSGEIVFNLLLHIILFIIAAYTLGTFLQSPSAAGLNAVPTNNNKKPKEKTVLKYDKNEFEVLDYAATPMHDIHDDEGIQMSPAIATNNNLGDDLVFGEEKL
jgi:hypothetical protein